MNYILSPTCILFKTLLCVHMYGQWCKYGSQKTMFGSLFCQSVQGIKIRVRFGGKHFTPTWIINIIVITLMFVCGCLYEVMYVSTGAQVRRGHWIVWTWSYRWLQAVYCVGNWIPDPRKTPSALNHWVISLEFHIWTLPAMDSYH